MGIIEVFTGPMRSGKSSALINKIIRFEIAKRKVILIKPKKDIRDGRAVKSRDGSEYSKEENIYQINSLKEIKEIINKIGIEALDLLAIDEFHLFEDDYEGLVDLFHFLAYSEINIAISTLDMSHNGRPFDLVGKVMCIADKVHKFKAICPFENKENAVMTMMNAPSDDDKVVGGDNLYQPASRKIWYERYRK